MGACRLKITIPEDHRLFVEIPEDFPAGSAELILLSEPPSIQEKELPEATTAEARGRLKAIAAQWAADPRPFRELSGEEREARLRQVVGIGRGLFSSSEEFAKRKQEEIELEERRFAR